MCDRKAPWGFCIPGKAKGMIFLCLVGDPDCDLFNCTLGVLIAASPFIVMMLLGRLFYSQRPSRPRKSRLRIEKAHVVMYPGAIRPEAIGEKKLKTALHQGAKYIEPYSHKGFMYSDGEDIWVPDGYMVVDE